MLIKIFIIIVLILIIASLFSAWRAIAKGEGNSDKAVRALTVRISLSLLLFISLMLGFHFGLIHR